MKPWKTEWTSSLPDRWQQIETLELQKHSGNLELEMLFYAAFLLLTQNITQLDKNNSYLLIKK